MNADIDHVCVWQSSLSSDNTPPQGCANVCENAWVFSFFYSRSELICRAYDFHTLCPMLLDFSGQIWSRSSGILHFFVFLLSVCVCVGGGNIKNINIQIFFAAFPVRYFLLANEQIILWGDTRTQLAVNDRCSLPDIIIYGDGMRKKGKGNQQASLNLSVFCDVVFDEVVSDICQRVGLFDKKHYDYVLGDG